MSIPCAFITGGTGLLGVNIIKELLLNTSSNLVLLVRNPSDKKRERLFNDIIAFNGGTWPGAFPDRRIKIVAGDITLPGLGLAPAVRDLLVSEINIIYHSAAIIKLSGAEKENLCANVTGTRNLLDFACMCKERGTLTKVVHVSTIAVSGDREGIIYEDELDLGQEFNNPYENSKFEAEKTVQEYRKRGLNILIVRPSMVIGDSTTGYTNNFNMFYFQLRFLSQGLLDFIPLLPGAAYNLVPADYTAKAICLISYEQNTSNNNFHIVTPHEIDVKQFTEKVCDYLGYKRPEMISLSDFCPSASILDGMRGRVLSIFFPYVSRKKIFDSTNADAVLRAKGFTWPKMDDILLTKMLDACIYSGYLRLGTEVEHEARTYN